MLLAVGRECPRTGSISVGAFAPRQVSNAVTAIAEAGLAEADAARLCVFEDGQVGEEMAGVRFERWLHRQELLLGLQGERGGLRTTRADEAVVPRLVVVTLHPAPDSDGSGREDEGAEGYDASPPPSPRRGGGGAAAPPDHRRKRGAPGAPVAGAPRRRR